MPPKGTLQPIFIFWAGHNDEIKVFFRSSKEHESISDLGETRTLTTSGDASYAQVLRRGNRIIVFTRVKHDRKWVYFVSDNAGKSWSNEKTFLESGPNHDWVYMTVQNRADNTNDVRIAVTEHPTVGEKHNVYFMTLKITTGDVIRHNDGGGSEVIANIYEENNLPLIPENLAIVHEAKEGETTRLFAVGGASTTEFAIGSFNKGERNALYKYVYWDNGPKTIDLIDSGPPIERPGESNYYFPGMSLSGTFEPGIVYIAREENLTRYMEKWTLKDDDTWDVRLIRKSTEDKVFRPISVLNGSKYELIWSEGRYTTFRDFDTKQILMESINGTKDVSSINEQEVGSVPVNYRYTESPNGSYKIYDDGTIECWHKIKLIYNSAQRLRGNWDLPIPLEKVHFVGSKCGGTSDITPNARDLAYNQVLEDGKDRVIVYQYRQDGGEDFEAGDELDCYVYVSGIWKV